MTVQPQLRISATELDPLRVTMRDTQQAVSEYYAATGNGQDLGRPVRAFLVAVQALNEHLSANVADSASYESTLTNADQSDADLINGIKYARNIAQHILHVVRPSDELTLVGGQLGMRVYAVWDDVPADVHAKLHKGTQKLKPAYEAALLGKEVTGTMLTLLRFVHSFAPDIVHRDHRGEWTGFPLMNQPGMSVPLHPEEPLGAKLALAWLDSRRPGGDARVICGQHLLNGTSYAFGHTFVGKHSFAPWIESVQQINIDMGLGYPYFTGDTLGNLEDVSAQFPQARQGGVLRSRGELDSWTTPVAELNTVDDWCADSHVDEWHRYVRLERGGILPEGMNYEIRRARRLNALVPPHV